MTRHELMKRINALLKLQSCLQDALVDLPQDISGKVAALLDDTWHEMRLALNSYSEGK